MCLGLKTGSGWPTRRLISRKLWFSLQQLFIVCSSSSWHRTIWIFFIYVCMLTDKVIMQVLFRQPYCCAFLSGPEEPSLHLTGEILILCLFHSFFPLSAMFPEPEMQALPCIFTNWGGCSSFSCSLHFDQLWISLLDSFFWKKKKDTSRWEVRAILICEYTDATSNCTRLVKWQ